MHCALLSVDQRGPRCPPPPMHSFLREGGQQECYSALNSSQISCWCWRGWWGTHGTDAHGYAWKQGHLLALWPHIMCRRCERWSMSDAWLTGGWYFRRGERQRQVTHVRWSDAAKKQNDCCEERLDLSVYFTCSYVVCISSNLSHLCSRICRTASLESAKRLTNHGSKSHPRTTKVVTHIASSQRLCCVASSHPELSPNNTSGRACFIFRSTKIFTAFLSFPSRSDDTALNHFGAVWAFFGKRPSHSITTSVLLLPASTHIRPMHARKTSVRVNSEELVSNDKEKSCLSQHRDHRRTAGWYVCSLWRTESSSSIFMRQFFQPERQRQTSKFTRVLPFECFTFRCTQRTGPNGDNWWLSEA